MNGASQHIQEGFFYRNRWAFGIIIAVVIIIALLVATKPETPTTPSEEKAWLVNSVKVSPQSHAPQIQVLGKVESPNTSTLSSSMAADVAVVAVREGELVEKDQLLVQLDDRDLVIKRQQLEADITDLRAQSETEKNRYKSDQRALAEEQKLLSIAEQALARQTKLKASNLVAQERLEQAESQRAQAALAVSNRQQALSDHPNRLRQLEARLLRAENALRQVRLDLERTQIQAPFAAWITHVPVSVGERVQTGQALVEIYEPDALEIRAQIPNRYAPRIREALQDSQTITAKGLWHDATIKLKLARLSARVNAASGGIDALFEPLTNEATLSLGATLTVQVELPAYKDSISLPVSALYGENRVYRIADGRLQTVFVNVLGQQFDASAQKDRVLVQSKDLQAGDLVITTQLPNAIDGLKIQRREAP